MKTLISILMLLASVVPRGCAATDVEYMPVDYNGFGLELPAGVVVTETAKEALYRDPAHGLGISLKVDKDRKATARSAREECVRLARDMEFKGGDGVRTIDIDGMKGAMTTGTVENENLTLVVLDTGGAYLKLLSITPPEHTDILDHVIHSLHRN